MGANIAARLLAYAVGVIEVAKGLGEDYVGGHVMKQLVRAGMSAGANYEEARAAESRADFVHKTSVALKELRESLYWLRIAAHVTSGDATTLCREATELSLILGKSIRTARAASVQ